MNNSWLCPFNNARKCPALDENALWKCPLVIRQKSGDPAYCAFLEIAARLGNISANLAQVNQKLKSTIK